MSNWLFISLGFIGIFVLLGLFNFISIFYSYAMSYTKAIKEWEAFKQSLEKNGKYKIELLRIENNTNGIGFCFYYTQKKIPRK